MMLVEFQLKRIQHCMFVSGWAGRTPDEINQREFPWMCWPSSVCRCYSTLESSRQCFSSFDYILSEPFSAFFLSFHPELTHLFFLSHLCKSASFFLGKLISPCWIIFLLLIFHLQRFSIHGMMEEEGNVLKPHQEIAALSLEEKRFLLAVERGDVASTRRWVGASRLWFNFLPKMVSSSFIPKIICWSNSTHCQ